MKISEQPNGNLAVHKSFDHSHSNSNANAIWGIQNTLISVHKCSLLEGKVLSLLFLVTGLSPCDRDLPPLPHGDPPPPYLFKLVYMGIPPTYWQAGGCPSTERLSYWLESLPAKSEGKHFMSPPLTPASEKQVDKYLFIINKVKKYFTTTLPKGNFPTQQLSTIHSLTLIG